MKRLSDLTEEEREERSSSEIDELASLFGSQAELARVLSLKPTNVSEWRRQHLGVPTRYHRELWEAARERGIHEKLPWWFPIYKDNPEQTKVPA